MLHVRSEIVTGALFALSGNTAYTYTYPGGAPTAGNLLVISVATESVRTVSSMAGTATTYSINGASTQNATATYTIEQWKAIATGSDTTVTITLSGSAAGVTSYVGFAEFSGAAADQSGSVANGASFDAVTAHNSGSVTPPTANNVVVASVERTSGTWTEDAAFTHVSAANAAFYFGYLLQSSATASEFNATSADNEYSAMRIGAFAGAAAGSTAVPVFVHHLRQQGIA